MEPTICKKCGQDLYPEGALNHCLSCGACGVTGWTRVGQDNYLDHLGDCPGCARERTREDNLRYNRARSTQKQHRVFEVGIMEQNSWTQCGEREHYCSFLKSSCGHTHTTVSGAARCLRRLSKYWADGSHNEWAHFGEIVAVGACGHPEKLTIIEQEKLDEINYR